MHTLHSHFGSSTVSFGTCGFSTSFALAMVYWSGCTFWRPMPEWLAPLRYAASLHSPIIINVCTCIIYHTYIHTYIQQYIVSASICYKSMDLDEFSRGPHVIRWWPSRWRLGIVGWHVYMCIHTYTFSGILFLRTRVPCLRILQDVVSHCPYKYVCMYVLYSCIWDGLLLHTKSHTWTSWTLLNKHFLVAGATERHCWRPTEVFKM